MLSKQHYGVQGMSSNRRVKNNKILSSSLTFVPSSDSPLTIWSLDFNGTLFRIRYKGEYLEPSGSHIKIVKGNKSLKELARVEALGPLLDAIKIEPESSDSSDSSDYSDSSNVGKNKKGKQSKEIKRLQKEAEKRNKDTRNRKAMERDPVIVNLKARSDLKEGSALSALDMKSNATPDYGKMIEEGEKTKTSGPGFYFQLTPVFSSTISKKVLIRYDNLCFTSFFKFEECRFEKWFKLPGRFYWHIYPTVDNSQIGRIGKYLDKAQRAAINDKMAKGINMDMIMAQNGIVDDTRNEESSSSSSSEEDCCCGNNDPCYDFNSQMQGTMNNCGTIPMQNMNNGCLPMMNTKPMNMGMPCPPTGGFRGPNMSFGGSGMINNCLPQMNNCMPQMNNCMPQMNNCNTVGGKRRNKK